MSAAVNSAEAYALQKAVELLGDLATHRVLVASLNDSAVRARALHIEEIAKMLSPAEWRELLYKIEHLAVRCAP